MANKGKVVTHCAAFVEFSGAGVPSYSWQSGEFTGTITDSGVGDIVLNLNANQGIDATECACVCTPHNPANWPLRVMHSVTHSGDTTKKIDIAEEGAGGIASVVADICFSFWCVRLANV